MRRSCRVDANQTKIVEAWRSAGASVKLVHQLKNFCDAIVAYNGVIYIAEIKDGSKGKSKLTPGEQAYKDEIELRGCKYHVIHNVNQALEMIKHVAPEERHPGVIGHERTCECKECKLLKKIFG